MAYFLILLFALAHLNAKDFGSYGTTYPISEESLLDVLKKRLHSVDFEEKKKEWLSNFKHSIENPKGKKLPNAVTERKFLFDPSVIAHQDIHDLEGKIIISKGTKVNPLDRCTMPEPLIFLNGTDEDQIIWAQKRNGIWILTQGNPIDLEIREKHPIYFDQSGYLCQKLGIKALPAYVSQENRVLKIEEIPCF